MIDVGAKSGMNFGATLIGLNSLDEGEALYRSSSAFSPCPSQCNPPKRSLDTVEALP